MPTMLREDERRRLHGILVGILDRDPYNKEQERYMLMKKAGLEDIVSGVDLSGPRLVVAEELIFFLEGYDGPLPDQPDIRALGALLIQLLTLKLDQNEAGFIAYLIAEHHLVEDPDYLDELREEYVGVPSISPVEAILSVSALMLIGVLAGFFPAKRAASLNPVQSLKM